MNRINFLLLCFFVAEISSTKIACVYKDDYFNAVTKDLTSTVKDTCSEDASGFYVTEGEVGTISNNFLSGVENLKKVRVNDANLKTVEPEAFKNLPKVTVIDLGKNHLGVIKAGIFNNIPELHELNLEKNSISSIEVGAFKNLPKLFTLDLSENHLIEIKKGIFENVQIQKLDLSQNEISEIEAGAFTGILAHETFRVEFDLHENQLEEINPEVFNHPKLGVLNLKENEITSIRPGDLANLPELEKLILSSNKLKTIPEGVFSGTKLQHLDLSENKLATIPAAAFNNIPKLKEVSLDDNKLTQWNANWFEGSPNITSVTASNNLIEHIPNEAFKNLPNCRNLRLNSNKIKTIASDAFKGTSLYRLVLEDNELEELSVVLDEGSQLATFLEAKGNHFKCSEVDKIRALAKSVYLDKC